MPQNKRRRTASAPPAASTPARGEAAAVGGTPRRADTEVKPPAPTSPSPHVSSVEPRGKSARGERNSSNSSVRAAVQSGASEAKGRRQPSSSENRGASATKPSASPAGVAPSLAKASVPGSASKATKSSPRRSAVSASPLVRKSPSSSPSPSPKLRRLDLEEAEEEQVRADAGAAVGEGLQAPAALPATSTVRDLESMVLMSKVIAPDVSGIACVAVNHDETELVVARENGSLVLYRVEYFQNIPHFTQLRCTGGRVRRTITRIAYLELPEESGVAGASSGDRYFVASYLSGQLVVYDSSTLFPVSVQQRTGGAVWDLCVADHGRCLYSAQADGSWHRLRVLLSRATAGAAPQPRLELERIVPRIAGADRAFSVTVSAALGIVVGTDDAGNVHAWRHATSATGDARDLSAHEALWTCRLPKGMAMCCAVADGSARLHVAGPESAAAPAAVPQRAAVAVGTSLGEVVILDALRGHILHTFATHKGPVSTVACDRNVFYASGWHEALRCFRFSAKEGSAATGEWYPAEVKRRTHYHEATQLVVLAQRQLVLSASRDGTLMYAPVAQLFSSPAMYVTVSTQRFAFAAEKNVLLHTRLDRLEAFHLDAAARHWAPAFAHNIHGKHHVKDLWCDASLHYIVFSTDERVVLAKVGYRSGAEAALAVTRIEEVLEVPAGRGVLDATFVPRTEAGASSPPPPSAVKAAQAEGGVAEGSLYLLFDTYVLSVALTDGYPVVRTELVDGERVGSDVASSSRAIRPFRMVHQPASTEPSAPACLIVFGQHGTWQCALTLDGTPEMDSASTSRQPASTFTRVQAVPRLGATGEGAASTVVGLCAAEDRYALGIACVAPASRSVQAPELRVQAAGTLPKTTPHDVTFVAELPAGAATAVPSHGNFLGYFSKGLVYVGRKDWRMVTRAAVEAAFVLGDGRRVLVLQRNLEKALEALPLCWKVRRFGN